MPRILLIYSTTDGHTLEICERLRTVMERQGHEVTLLAIEAAMDVDPAAFDKLVLGASIRYGKHHQRVHAFIDRHARSLAQMPNAFFSVNLVARKAEKRSPQTNPYLKKFLRRIPWQPKQLAVFAGKLDYPRYGFMDRQIIRLIMWMTKGPTDPSSVIDFTDWDQVEAFGERLGRGD